MHDPNTRASTRAPVAARRLSALAAVERHEVPAVAAAFFLFFCIFAGYFAVRPVRETVGTLLGRDRVADLWIATWAASLAIVPVYGLAVARLRRSVFLPWTYGLVAVALALVAGSLGSGQVNVAAGQFFYVFISVLNLFLVSVFWSFLLELFDSGQAKRLFPVIAAGGTAGALAGPVFTDFTVATIGNAGILLAGAALFGVAVVCQRLLIVLWKGGRSPRAGETAEAVRARDRAIGGNPLAGFTIVWRSPYLLGLALFITLLSTANTLLYFEQLRLVDQAFADTETRTRVFARLDWIVQGLTILSQLFLTGPIAVAFGVTALLTIVPLAMIAGFTALAAWNSFAVLAVVIVARRFGEYAFVRPGREMLWSPLDQETKYKAKNLLDVPVYRGSDALVAQLQRAVENAGTTPQAIALAGAAAAAVWAINGLWLGRRYEEATAAAPASEVTPATGPRPVGAGP